MSGIGIQRIAYVALIMLVIGASTGVLSGAF